MSLEERLKVVFEDVFGLASDRFSLDAAPEDVSNWDSIGHMNLVLRLEKEFSQRFDVDEIMEMVSPRKIMEILRGKGVGD